jgi:hypothetical protein
METWWYEYEYELFEGKKYKKPAESQMHEDLRRVQGRSLHFEQAADK